MKNTNATITIDTRPMLALEPGLVYLALAAPHSDSWSTSGMVTPCGSLCQSRTKPLVYTVSGDAECWLWARGKSAGYGKAYVIRDGRRHAMLAHRYFSMVASGFIPDKKLLHHTCNNPACCNPAHLLPMTKAEHQRIGKGTKLTDDMRHGVVRLRIGGMTYTAIAKVHDVTPSCIWAYLSGKTWDGEGPELLEAIRAGSSN
jgi:hypothetical protein